METINHEVYVSLEIAKLLKEAGFDWEVEKFWWYDKQDRKHILSILRGKSNGYFAPSLDVAQRWLREVKAIHICVKADAASINCKYFVTVIVNDTKWGNIQDENKKTILFSTYEEAQEAGIRKALEIILKKEEYYDM